MVRSVRSFSQHEKKNTHTHNVGGWGRDSDREGERKRPLFGQKQTIINYGIVASGNKKWCRK